MTAAIPKRESVDFVSLERERIRFEYDRRAREIDSDRYASWQPAEQFIIGNRNRMARSLIQAADISLTAETKCLEIGCGAGGWFSELIEWGIAENCLHGIELDPVRGHQARARFPAADISIGDAVELPWAADTFQIVVASTVLTSVLDAKVRQLIADEVQRVIAPNGALLWYDFAFNNPRNPHVRGIRRSEIRRLFPVLNGEIRSVTLAPPLARLLAPRSRNLAQLLESVPLLRTHLLGVLRKGASRT